MTREEAETAWRDQTWVVLNLRNTLGRITSREGDDVWWVCEGTSTTAYWVHEKNLRIATAKDFLELSE